MAERTFKLLKSLAGKKASINGATQIRAGVMRPEVIVPLEKVPESKKTADISAGTGLDVGMSVRIIRQPHFGAIGKVTALPVKLANIEIEIINLLLKLKEVKVKMFKNIKISITN